MKIKVTTSKLIRVIQSLKKEEKRYFKLFVKRRYNTKDKNRYIQLFDYLDKQSNFDKKAYKEKFKAVQNLSALQSYLYRLIIKSLQQQKAEHSVEEIILSGLAEIKILYDKDLVSLVKEKVDALTELAEFHDKILLLPLIYEWKFRIENTRSKYNQTSKEAFDVFYQRVKTYPPRLEEYFQARLDISEIIFCRMQAPNEIQATIEKHVYEAEPPIFKSIPATIAWFQTRTFYCSLVKDYAKAKIYQTQLYQYLQSLPPDIQKEKKGFLVNSLVGTMSLTFEPKDIEPLFQKFEELVPDKEIYNYLGLASVIIYKKHQYLLIKKDYQAALNYIKRFDIAKLTLDAETFGLMQYFVALNHFALEEYNETLNTLDSFLLQSKHATSNINIYSTILKIITLYEQEEFLLLPYFLRNTKLHFKRKDILLEFAKLFISFFSKIINVPLYERPSRFIKFKEQLLEFLETQKQHEKAFLMFFNYWAWIDKHAYQKPFVDILKLKEWQ